MFKVGLSGNLCSGYEDVATQFKKLGVPVFDADAVLKFMIHYDEVISKEIRIKFGETSFQNGFLNERAFNSVQKLNLLLDMLNMRLMQSYEKFRIKHKTAPYTIFKFALLFEREFDLSMNFNINTFTPKDDRVLRLKESEGLPFVEAYSLVENGPDDILKNKLATYIIHNYEESKVGIDVQVSRIDKMLKEKAEPSYESGLSVDSINRNVFI